MARTFRRQRTAQPIAELNITNLVDLAFVLLIVFMIATPLIHLDQTIPVNLPVVAKLPPAKTDQEDTFVAVGVDASGRFYVENKTAPITLLELQSRLRAFAQETKPPVIRIQGDAAVPYQKVAELFSEVQKAGLTRFTIDSQADN